MLLPPAVTGAWAARLGVALFSRGSARGGQLQAVEVEGGPGRAAAPAARQLAVVVALAEVLLQGPIAHLPTVLVT